ncbi:MAG: transcriptional regulator, MarR family [Massilibacillus sp.]|jgi:DNA-binding MarR family transcriptional regulator|nr:transcriptional regulator, MarR family [Massilibacillus sp.]
MSTEDVIVKAINILSESMRECMRKHKEKTPDSRDLFNLSITQLHYLHAIREKANPTITELAEIFGVQKSTVTVAINKLLERQFIEKTASKTDLRVVHITLSEKGKRLIEIEDMGYYQFASQVMEALDETEIESFAFLLTKVTNNTTRN